MTFTRNILIGTIAGGYLLTGLVAGEYLIRKDFRDEPLHRGIAAVAWPVLFVVKAAQLMDVGSNNNSVCCRKWQGDV